MLADELEVVACCGPLERVQVLEVGCGKARTARALLHRHPQARVIGIEPHAALVDGHAARPQAGLTVLLGRGEALPFGPDAFDQVWMLKSLHHMAQPQAALAQAWRVLRSGGWLYVSEPVYEGDLNDLVRLYNDEGPARARAQQALDGLDTHTAWRQESRWHFVQPVHFVDAQDFERRMMADALARRQHDPAAVQRLRAQVQSAYAPHQTADGAHFVRPMLARAFQRA